MTNEQELNSVADKEIFELAEILLALQSRLPPVASEASKTNAGAMVEVKKATPTPATPSVSLVAAAAEHQVMVMSPPSSPEVQSKKENHAPVTPVVNNKRPAPVTASGEAASKKDPAEQERKKRKRVTEEQLTVLETIFATDKMPDQKLRLQLAQRLGMSSRRVQIWFQNKRAKLKKANSNSPSSSPTMGHSIGKLGGSQALYSARFSLPSANNNNNNASQGTSNTKASASTSTNTTATVATGSHNTSSSNNNNSNNTSSGSTPTPNLVAPFNFPLSFHPFASSNFLGGYSNSSMPGASYSLPISRPVK